MRCNHVLVIAAQARAAVSCSAAQEGERQSSVSVVGLTEEALAAVCATVQRDHPSSICQVSVRLFPQNVTIAGHAAAVAQVLLQRLLLAGDIE